MSKILTPRSAAALAVVAACFFLMVCVAQYGGATLADPRAATGFASRLTLSIVETVGAGIWVLLLLPMAWGVIVYFQERTPDLLMRFVGTVILAVSTSTIAGLLHAGPWAGHVGNGVAGALGGLSTSLGGFGTAIAWLLALALLGASFVFATDWCFHALRRASRAAANEVVVIAEEPARAEFLETPAEAQPREFVVETPRAAVAAAEMADIVGETSDELVIPGGWDEVEEEGRTVISAPGGYRGVEFLPPSDELAVPDAPAVTHLEDPTPSLPVLEEIEAEAAFEDQHFVTTPDAAFFVEEPSEDRTEEVVAEAETPAVDEDEVADAVETLFAAVTTPAPAAETPAQRASGIGLPEESPFLDEFFAVDAGWPYAPLGGPSDGASAADEMATRFAPEAAPASAPPAPAPAPETPAVAEEQISIDEILVSRIPAQAFDDEIAVEEAVAEDTVDLFPAAPSFEPSAETPISAPEAFVPAALSTYDSASAVAVAEPVVVAPVVAVAAPPVVETPAAVPEVVAAAPAPVVVVEPAPQLTLFAETAAPAAPVVVAPAAPAPVHELDLSRLHAMELDPLFHDAVNAILERGRASAVVLQRHLGIGYARGIRILDQMTAGGLVGPDTPTGTRELRVTKEQWSAFNA